MDDVYYIYIDQCFNENGQVYFKGISPTFMSEIATVEFVGDSGASVAENFINSLKERELSGRVMVVKVIDI